MKFAIKYYRGCRTLSEADEIIIQYNEKNSNLIDFVQKYNYNQRIIVDISNLKNIEDNLKIFETVYSIHSCFAILLRYGQCTADLAEMNIPYFFLDGASTFDEMVGIVNCGVSDIYIINELGFNLKEISKYCHNKNVKIRVYPNVAQTISKFPTKSLTNFFIRPDAIKIYEPYVDVFEFFGPLDRQPALFDIYKDERWLGQLDDVIIDLKENIDNRTIVPYFDTIRANCKKICNLEKCDVCKAVENFGKTLETKEIGIKREKAEHDRNEYKINENSMSTNSSQSFTDINDLFKEEISESYSD